MAAWGSHNRIAPRLLGPPTATMRTPFLIAKILAHLGLPIRAPPRLPAQVFDLFQMA